MVTTKSLSIIIPALDEENNISETLENIINACRQYCLDWELIVIDDGSTDKTGEIAEEISHNYPNIHIICHKKPSGIGHCFREGAERANKDVVTWIPSDGESDIEELLKYLSLIDHVDIVIPFVLNVGIRRWHRRLLSLIYLWIINLSFGTTFNYTNGNVLFKRGVLKTVINRSNSFFFQTECLIKAIRYGFVYAEVPIRLKKRKKGSSKALSIRQFCRVILDYARFFIAVHILHTAGRAKNISSSET